jgi:type IV pilus assembly protein PilO
MPIKNNASITAAISGLLVCIIFYTYWSLVLTPIRKFIETERRNSQDLTRKLDVARSRASQLSKVQAEMASLQIEVAELEKLLPKTRELPSLLRVLTHRAEANGVVLNTFRPQRPVSKGLYDEVPYDISATASVHGMGRFLTAMGKGERLFAARNLALTASSGKSDPSKTVTASFTLVAFKYHE